jgi:hypothetical protein
MIEVELLSQKKYTTSKDDIGGGTAMCSWNEHIFFEPRNIVRLLVTLKYLLGKRGYRGGQDLSPYFGQGLF